MADEYIKREAAIEACCGGCNPAMCSNDCDEVAAIRAIPAADVAPVRHGRWIKKHDDVCYWHECSECGMKPPKDQWKNEWKSPYCPNCGAKMDGVEK